MLNNLKDWILNHVAVFCINHCRNYSDIFHSACKQMSTLELKIKTDMIIKEREEE